jgi:PqqD family protein of HPr-rel-A system
MWQVISGQCLRYRCWDDEAVLYNDLSGATHLLGLAALCLLDVLRTGPADEAALAAALAAEFDVDGLDADGLDAGASATDLRSEVAGLLDDLARLDLIERCPC